MKYKNYRLITVLHEKKKFHFFTKSTHSISIYQKLFDLWCTLTTNKTTVNFLVFLSSLSGTNEGEDTNLTLNNLNKLKNE